MFKKQYNRYDLSGDYGIGWTNDGYKFIFDLEDYDKICQYCWHKHIDGYLRTLYETYYDEEGKRHHRYIMMHQLIFPHSDCSGEIDHINGRPWDNRKSNLRFVTHTQNMQNLKISSANTSGHKGVSALSNGKWMALISIDKHSRSLGTFETYEEAVKAREEGERKYYKEFRRSDEYL